MSGKCVKTGSVGCNNCKYCIGTHQIFPILSCVSKALSEILLQILKLGVYFVSNSSTGLWFFNNTMSPTLNSVLSESQSGGGYLSQATLRLSTAIMYISHMTSRWILHSL